MRLIATTYAAAGGTIDVGAPTNPGGFSPPAGGNGRVRIEAYNFTGTTTTFPGGVVASSGIPGVVLPTGLPSLTITSVGGGAAPASPTGSYATPDVTMGSGTPSPGPLSVTVAATNILAAATLTLRAKPQTGPERNVTVAGVTTWPATGTIDQVDLTQPNVLSAEATFQLQAAADVPASVVLAAGPDDPVTHVRVAAAFGGGSRRTYLTRSGRELVP